MTKKIRIARVVTAPEAVIFHLRNTLDARCIEWDLTIIGTNVSQFKSRWPHVSWIDISISRKVSLWADLVSLVQLTIHFTFNRYEIVHSILPKAGLLAAISAFITRIPIRLHTFTGQVWANKVGARRSFFVFLDRVIVHLNTCSYTDSFSQSQFLFENGVSQNGNALKVLGSGSLSGVNTSHFNPTKYLSLKEPLREKIGIANDSFIFVFIGRKCRDKGVLDLLDAFSILSRKNDKIALLLVGPDEDPLFQEKYEKYKITNKIFNIGFTNTPEIYLSLADVFCLPSHREGFGTVVIEAACMGVPSIGTSIPGLTDAIIDGTTGILVKMGNVDELSAAMAHVAEFPETLQKMAKVAQRRAREEFSSKILFEALRSEYSKLIKMPP